MCKSLDCHLAIDSVWVDICQRVDYHDKSHDKTYGLPKRRSLKIWELQADALTCSGSTSHSCRTRALQLWHFLREWSCGVASNEVEKLPKSIICKDDCALTASNHQRQKQDFERCCPTGGYLDCPHVAEEWAHPANTTCSRKQHNAIVTVAAVEHVVTHTGLNCVAFGSLVQSEQASAFPAMVRTFILSTMKWHLVIW